MVSEWVPGERRDMLSGRPGIVWGRWMLGCALAVPVLAVLLAVGMGVSGRGYGESYVLFAGMAILGADVLALVVFQILASVKLRAEHRSGYTTARDEVDFDEVDYRSGYVIRRAGEPLLSREQREFRAHAICTLEGKSS